MNEYQDWFERCVSKTALLSRMKFEYDYGDNPKQLVIGRRTSNVDDDPQVNAKLAISQLVNDIEHLVIELLDEKGGAIYSDSIKDSSDYLVSIETSLGICAIPYGVAKDYYRSPSMVQVSDLILVPEHLGTITFYVGESPAGTPGLWLRTSGEYAQAGVALKVTELKNYQAIV